MTDDEIQEVIYMEAQADKYGLLFEVRQAFDRYIAAGDSVAEATYCALCDWDVL